MVSTLLSYFHICAWMKAKHLCAMKLLFDWLHLHRAKSLHVFTNHSLSSRKGSECNSSVMCNWSSRQDIVL
jgi:hypothetical protein